MRTQIPIRSLVDDHIESSHRFILEASGAVSNSAAALVLGSGNCGEIPVALLQSRFGKVCFVDVDLDALKALAARHHEQRGRCEYRRADLTGMIGSIAAGARQVAATASDAPSMLDELATLLMSTVPRFWVPPDDQRYDLLICSGILTQLQAKVRSAAEQVFRLKYHDGLELLSSHHGWRRATWHVARRLEDGFVAHLNSLTTPGGVIYLSDTVRVNWLTQSDEQTFTTDGTWIATRTAQLTDYLLPSTEIIAQGQWWWLRQQREGPYWGRLYDVQAVAYR